MSRRITYKSQIKDRDLAITALTDLQVSYRDLGEDQIQITSGAMSRAIINLKTGEVVSDSDYHNHEDLGGLRQAYSEADVRRVMNRQGATQESRTVLANGDVKLRVRMHA
jgi:hypothetical protein